MRWPAWLLRRLGAGRDGAAERAEREQRAKQRELDVTKREVRREVNRFTADVEAAMVRRYR